MCPVPLLSNGLLFVISVSCLIILLQDADGLAVLEGINRLSSLYEELLLRGAIIHTYLSIQATRFGGQTFMLMTDGDQNDARNDSPYSTEWGRNVRKITSQFGLRFVS